MTDYKTIAESKNFIVLDKYIKEWKVAESYQSESDLERELIQDLVNQGYEYRPDLNTPAALLANVRVQLQVIRQFEQTGSHANRCDVTSLVNGLPLVQVELKKRGVPSGRPSTRCTATLTGYRATQSHTWTIKETGHDLGKQARY